MHPWRRRVLLAASALLLGGSFAPGLSAAASPAHPARPAHSAAATAGGLTVSVAYAENKESNTPDSTQFPVPWAGAPNTQFLGNVVPGTTACGSVPFCYDAGAIRLDNPGTTDIGVASVSVDDHSSISGGKNFGNLWGSFTVGAGKSVILTENPPANNPNFNNFDTSSFPSTCTPITVAPTIAIAIGGAVTTLADSTHIIDTHGIDLGTCPPKRNESIQWRQVGASGSDSASLSLGPATATNFVGTLATETATLLDGSGFGLPNATVNFKVISGPNAGLNGSSTTDINGHAVFTYSGNPGEDVLVAAVTTVGSFQSNRTRVMWTDDSSAGWTGVDIGGPTPAGSQSLNAGTGTWTVSGGGSDINGTSDQFHFVSKSLSGDGGVTGRVASQTNTSTAAKAGVMLRTSSDPGSPYYAAFVTLGNSIVVQDRATQGGATATVANMPGTAPVYVWVNKKGGSLTAFTSSDGYLWQPIAGSTVALSLGGSPLLAGLAVTSHNSAQLDTASIDSVAVSSSPPAPLPPSPCPAPWTCADIGNPTPAGNNLFDPNNNTWTINAGGADITGTGDQFRYVWQSLSGDGSVSARVATQTNTSTSAKAGVMLRVSTDPGAPNYAVLVSPGAGIKVQVRSTQGGSTTKLANPTGTTPAYLKVARAGNTFTAYTSPDGTTWNLIAGSTFTMTLPAALLQGLAATSHNSGALSSVTMDAVAVGSGGPPPPPPPPPGCPAPWTCADIGNPTPAGTQTYDSGSHTWNISAGGADITGTTDQFRFVSQSLTGDGSISVHIASQTNTSSSAKAGVMFRASADPSAPYYGVVITPAQGIKVQERNAQGGSTTKLANPAGTVPAWLRITRAGNTFTTYTSADGLSWTLIAGSSFTLALPATVLEGMAVTSHNTGQLCTVAYDQVLLT